MPPKRHPTVWEAEPHTIAKIEMLQAYLHAWFSVFGLSRPGQDLLYIDGFAGPDEYTNRPTGSPTAALNAATTALTSAGSRWRAGDIHCAFIESDARRFAHLEKHVEPFQATPKLHIHLFRASFVDGLAALKQRVPRPFNLSYPLFTFIDPFGATGAPFSTVADLLRSPSSEVLINLDADGISRIRHAGPDASHDLLLDEIFGDASWRSSLPEGLPFTESCLQALNLYKERLRQVPNVRYVFSFEMRSRGDRLNYFLVFASQHPLGLEKMKEAMKRCNFAEL